MQPQAVSVLPTLLQYVAAPVPGGHVVMQSREHDNVGGLKLKGSVVELPLAHTTTHPTDGVVPTQLPFLQANASLQVLPSQHG